MKTKSQLQVVKSLVKKYPNDMELGGAVRRFLTQDYWLQKSNTKEVKTVKEYEQEWLERLEKI
jgi:hypothetical protein|tara:strand:- start:4087 stop:4275 length:189 start_codon:yes stop_codon:yes gene_type:complete